LLGKDYWISSSIMRMLRVLHQMWDGLSNSHLTSRFCRVELGQTPNSKREPDVLIDCLYSPITAIVADFEQISLFLCDMLFSTKCCQIEVDYSTIVQGKLNKPLYSATCDWQQRKKYDKRKKRFLWWLMGNINIGIVEKYISCVESVLAYGMRSFSIRMRDKSYEYTESQTCIGW
jgi:hypothetical protein